MKAGRPATRNDSPGRISSLTGFAAGRPPGRVAGPRGRARRTRPGAAASDRPARGPSPAAPARGCASRCGRSRGRTAPTGRPCRRRRASSRPTRRARLPSCSHQRSSCVHRAVAARRPARGSCRAARGRACPSQVSGRLPPATSRIVGTRSMTWPGVVPQFAAGGDALRPVDDQRRGDAAFVHPGLVPAERRVGHASTSPARGRGASPPSPAGAAGSWPSPRTMISALAPLSERKRISVLSKRLHRAELVEDAADLAVHAVDHRRVDRHLRRLKRALLVGQLVPGQRAGSPRWGRAVLIASGKVVRRADVALDVREAAVDEPELLHPLPALARGRRPSPSRYCSR